MDNNKNMQGKHKDTSNLKGMREKQTEEVCSNTRLYSEHKNEGEILLRPDMEGL